jgi:hypothetical protein
MELATATLFYRCFADHGLLTAIRMTVTQGDLKDQDLRQSL